MNSSKQQNEWPTPTPLEHPDLPKLEPDMLPGWARDYVEALAKATETPLELSAAMVLASCSIATARTLKVQVESGYEEPTNLWLIVALPSGSRKSAVQSKTTAPLTRWERDEAKRLMPDIKRAESMYQTAMARAKSFRRKAANAKTREESEKFAEEALAVELSAGLVPRLPRLWTSDTTPEKLGMLLADHGECMGWLSSEGGFFDAQKGRYSEIPNLDLILKAHAGDAERVDRATRQSVLLENPLLTIGLSPQPSVLQRLATVPGFRGRGLLARFLYLIPPSNLGYRALKPVPIPEAVEVAYRQGLTAMLAGWGQPYPKFTVRLSDEAHQYLNIYRREVETQMRDGGELCHLKDWAGKAPGAAVRLAGVLHGIVHAHSRPWEVPISGETMVQAIRLMLVFKRHTLAAFGLMAASPVLTGAKRVLGWFERHYLKLQEQGKIVTRTAIWSDVKDNRTFRSPRDLDDAFGMLIEHGFIFPYDLQNGQPVERLNRVRFVANPHVVEGWKGATNDA